MLQIKNISKQYKTGELVQNALKDLSLNLRDNEFVSILGPSGSGKTTLLNIIGGLDRYDSGDLIINHVSTEKYGNREWDAYRNHTIGFVFQSYNLIPHQTVLANVELALTIGGVSRKERKRRALEALDKVGLKDQAHKKPNQMSGGQMQRVAIARALVNDPDILLADEPTGALDTETSVQVMDLLKEVASDRLVIMVTHNPELAETYSTRIVKLKDGQIVDDSNPYIVEEKEDAIQNKKLGKASMSIWTAFALSFNNLLTKKGRTILTAFAGSIGIIGIALILSLSTGFKNYIDQIQEDTLTSYPLTINAETADALSALLEMSSQKGERTGEDTIKEKQYIGTMFSKVSTNDLKSLKEYLEAESETVNDMVSLVQYKYSVTPMIYTKDVTDSITQLNPSNFFASLSGGSGTAGNMMGMSSAIFNEMMDDEETLQEQYDVLAGRWPKKYDEVIIVLSEPNGIPDILVYGLGLRDINELKEMIGTVMAGNSVGDLSAPLEFKYDDLLNLEFKLVNPSDTYKYNEAYNIYESMVGDSEYMAQVYDKAQQIKIVGVVCVKEGVTGGNLTPGVAYKSELTKHVIAQAAETEIVKKQLENPDINVFSNKRFDDDSEQAGLTFEDMISVDTDMLSSAFGVQVNETDIQNMTQGYMNEISAAITADTKKAEEDFSLTLSKFATDMLRGYIQENKNPLLSNVAQIKMSDVDKVVNGFVALESTQLALNNLEASYIIPKDTFQTMYSELLKGLLQGYISLAGGESADPQDPSAFLTDDVVDVVVAQYITQEVVASSVRTIASSMTEAIMQKTILTKVGELSGELMQTMAGAFNVDENQIAAAFKFEMSEEELTRLMETMSASTVEQNINNNLVSLGYQDLDRPSAISFYFNDFESKEAFVKFIDEYNEEMEKSDDSKVIKYVDITGIIISSVKIIVDSVSYVLIAFVSISLVVSSIMIGIITYISVLERKKEIGVLRAIGASKRNISSIFNAETFIVGLAAGLLGIAVVLAMIPPINSIIHSLTGNNNINAMLPVKAGVVLVILSVILTLIGGLIPSKQAAKKDPVLALRSE